MVLLIVKIKELFDKISNYMSPINFYFNLDSLSLSIDIGATGMEREMEASKDRFISIYEGRQARKSYETVSAVFDE